MSESVALLSSIDGTAFEAFESVGYGVTRYPKSISQEGLRQLTFDAVALGVRSGPKISSEALGDALKVIGVFGTGTDHITFWTPDRRGADDLGIAVFNADHENSRPVAEYVIGAIITLFRDFHYHVRKMHQDGIFSKQDGRLVQGATLGLVGYGAVGSQTAVMAESLGMEVIAYDKKVFYRHGRGQIMGLGDVIENADVLSLHASGDEDNRHLLDHDSIATMKRGSYVINAARAMLIDYRALDEALRSGHLAGAAIDVWTDEDNDVVEPEPGEEFNHFLLENTKVFATPHIAGSTRETAAVIGERVANKMIDYLETGNTETCINLPQMSLKRGRPGVSRLLNIHDSQPGVDASVKTIVAARGLNVIDSRVLAPGTIGYEYVDVDGEIPQETVEEVEELEVSRETRVLTF